MAVTKYYTFGGRLLAENQIGGTGFRSYGHDDVGSVIATYDNTGMLQDAFRYSPYGTSLIETSPVIAPYFCYLGSLSHRATGREFFESYSDERHYSSSLAQWTTVNRLWTSSGVQSYSTPAPTQPPSATAVSIGVVPNLSQKWTANYTGGSYSAVNFIPPNVKDRYYIIQQITNTMTTKDCNGNLINVGLPKNPLVQQFYEPFCAQNGLVGTPACSNMGYVGDAWTVPGMPYTTISHGIYSQTVIGKLYWITAVQFSKMTFIGTTPPRASSCAGCTKQVGVQSLSIVAQCCKFVNKKTRATTGTQSLKFIRVPNNSYTPTNNCP
jgi:hypothetical protein